MTPLHVFLYACLIAGSIILVTIGSLIIGVPGMLSAGIVWFGLKAASVPSALAFLIAVGAGGTFSAYAMHRLYVYVYEAWISRFSKGDGQAQDTVIKPEFKNYREGLLYFYPATALGLLATLWSNPVGSWFAGLFFSAYQDFIGALITGYFLAGFIAIGSVAIAVWRKRIRFPELAGRF